MEQPHRNGAADGGKRGADGRCQQKAQDTIEIVELERWTEPPDDEPRCKYGLAGIAQAAEYRGPEIPVAQEIGNNGCDDDANRHRPPRARPQCYENAGGQNTATPSGVLSRARLSRAARK